MRQVIKSATAEVIDGRVFVNISVELIPNVTDNVKEIHGDATLTAQENRVFKILREGEMQNKEIADALNLSLSTVKFHVANIMRKKGCTTRYQIRELFAEAK